jgi:hypothetical protein
MTHTRLGTMPALLAVASLMACSGAPTNAPAAAAQTAATPAAAAPLTPAHATVAPDAATVTGSVAATMNSGGYTYARLQTGKGDVWIAAREFVVQAGERLTVPLEMPMPNFHSQTLNRDFPMIYFVTQVARDGQTLSSAHGQPAALAMTGSRQSAAAAPVERIAPAPGGMSIADVWAKRTSLAGKQVVVRGAVVRVNDGIMGRNWLHLQDGSGSAADRTNDLVVTTAAEAKVGDIVTMSGMLAIGKDFGAGYVYDAILEKATVK